MSTSSLPSELQAQLERALRYAPKAAPTLERIVARHAAASSDEQRARAERDLRTALGILGNPQRDSRLKLALGIGLPVLMFGALGASLVLEHRTEELIARGVPTTARVDRMEEGNCWITAKRERCLELTVKVYPQGGAAYSAKLTQAIEGHWLPRVQPGAWLVVAVSKEDPSKVAVDQGAFSVAPPAPVPEP